MKKLMPLGALLLLLCPLGCGEGAAPSPPATEAEYKASMPDEVREFEERAEKKAKAAAAKHPKTAAARHVRSPR